MRIGCLIEMKTKVVLFYFVVLISCKTKSVENISNETVSVNSGTEPMRKVSVEKLFELAEVGYRLAAYTEAVMYLNEIIRRDSLQGKAFFRRGNSYAGLSDLDKSNQDYLKAIQLGYHVPNAYYNIGCNYVGRNDSLALMYFKKTLDIDPHHEKAKSFKSRIEKSSPKKHIGNIRV